MAKIKQEFQADVPVDALQKHPKNPRRGDLPTIQESICFNGFYGAVLVQRSTGYILAGNHRYDAALNCGASTLPVIWLDVDDKTAMRILLADNRTRDLASYNAESLANLLSQLAENCGGLAGTGYTNDNLQALLASIDTAGKEPVSYDLIVSADSEADRDALYETLACEGFECRVM